MIPRAGALYVLYRFCAKHAIDGKIGNLTVNTIIRLACVLLETNYFVYDNKYYKQIRGGAMGSPFAMTLANIYICMNGSKHCLNINKREMNSMAGKSISKAKSFIISVFFIRYIDDIFITSNESLDIIKELLDKEGQKDANIGMNLNIHHSTMEFLDVLIENNQKQLKTSVYRKPAAEPYILPYTSYHPRHIHSNTIHTALLRAIRLSSDVQTFDHERLNIEISLLLNGYSPKFITHHYKRFYRKYNA